MKKILIISRHEIILASLLNHLYENGYDAMGALRDAEALSFLKSFKPDAVILAGPFDQAELQRLMTQFIGYQLDLPVLVYQGSAKGLLEKVNKYFNQH